MKSDNINDALISIFSGINLLRSTFKQTKRQFTIDGRLVGDIGEVIAARDFQITLHEKSQPLYDADCNKTNMPVQVKATFQNALTFKQTDNIYFGIKLETDGSYEVIFNGPASLIFERYKHRKDIGKKLLRFPIKELRILNNAYDGNMRISTR